MSLPTNYKDQVLDTTQNVKRKYTMIDNGDGTYSFDDETVYSEQGSPFGAGDINETNGEVNTLNENLTANGQPFYFDTHDGKYGWNESSARGADTFHPFSSDLLLDTQINNYPRFDSNNSQGTRTFSVPQSLADCTNVYAVITGTFQNYYNFVTWSCSGGNIITNTSCVSSSGNNAPFKTFITTMKLTGNSVSVTYKPFADHHISVTFIGA